MPDSPGSRGDVHGLKHRIYVALGVPTVAASVDLVVHLGMDRHGTRRVNEIVAVPGRAEQDTIETETLFARRGDALVRATGMPPRPERFERLGVDVHGLLNEAG